jgi:hypothetical protein
MGLAQKFKIVAAIEGGAPPTCMEVDKPYSIMWAFKKSQLTDFIIILLLGQDNDERLKICVLRPSSHLFGIIFQN